MYIKKKYKGKHADRYGREPLEEIFAQLWQERDEPGQQPFLGWLLSTNYHEPENVSERDYLVAATVVQWFGSTVGQGFLRNVFEAARNKNLNFPAYTMMVCDVLGENFRRMGRE